MNFQEPVSYRKRDGSVGSRTDFRLVIVDDCSSRTVVAYLIPAPARIPLWSGDAYDLAGDYTQAQVEARVAQVISSNPAIMLPPTQPENPSA